MVELRSMEEKGLVARGARRRRGNIAGSPRKHEIDHNGMASVGCEWGPLDDAGVAALRRGGQGCSDAATVDGSRTAAEAF